MSTEQAPSLGPRRRSFTNLVGRSGRGRTRDDDGADDRSMGGRSTQSARDVTGAARRRRSRSPLRAASKTSKSIVGKLTKFTSSRKSKKDKMHENAAMMIHANAAIDEDKGSSSSSAREAPSVASAPPKAGGSEEQPKTRASAAGGSFDDDDIEYGVVLDAPKEEGVKPPAPATFEREVEAAKKAVAQESAPPAPALKEEDAESKKKESSKKQKAEKKKKEEKKKQKKEEKEEKEAAAPKKSKSAEVPSASAPKKEEPQVKKSDEADKTSQKTAPAPAPYAPPAVIARGSAIQIILLLMDPSSRRFELLQLEFDSSRALVSDVLAQIPLSATVESMRIQTYRGVCDRRGGEMDNGTKLVEFTRGKEGEVVLAIPRDMTAKECSKLAKPILSDPNVVAMLNPAALATVRESSAEKKEQAPEKTEEEKKAEKAAPEPEAKARSAAPVVPEKKAESSSSSSSSSGSAFFRIFSVLLLVAIAVPAALMKLQHVITAPLGPGDALRPGSWRSRCGLLSIVPSRVLAEIHEEIFPGAPVGDVCEPGALEMGRDGVLRLYDGLGKGGEVSWEVAGGVCPEDGDGECVPGLVVGENGKLVIGGRTVKLSAAALKGLVPWPFVKEISEKASSK